MAYQHSFSKVIFNAPTVHNREQRRVQYNWSNGNPKYLAYNVNSDAVETDTDWEITKYTEDVLKQQGPFRGAVNSEAVINALSWDI